MGEKKEDTVTEKKDVKKKGKKKKIVYGTPNVKKGKYYYKKTGQRLTYENWDDTGVSDTQKNEMVPEPLLKDSVILDKCTKTVVHLENKCAEFTATNCSELDITVDSIVNKLSVVSCKKCKITIKSSCPIVEVSKCDTTNLFVSRKAAGDKDNLMQIITEQSAFTNVTIPDASDDAEPKEMAVPEQFVRRFNLADDMKEMALNTEIVAN